MWYHNALNKRPGNLLNFLRKKGGVDLKIRFQPNILFFFATKLSKISTSKRMASSAINDKFDQL